jgi:type IV fimbrial biogenesis protein FimT
VLKALTKSKSSGMTIIELMMGITILAIVLGLAAPSFSQWTRNLQIRNAAESIANGLQRARAEAVSRNTDVAFGLGADSAWTVTVVAPAAVVATRSASEGSQNVTRTVLPGGATTITFNNLGIAVANADASASLAQIDLVADGGNKNLRVEIGVGGIARMCDPNLASGSSPRAC